VDRCNGPRIRPLPRLLYVGGSDELNGTGAAEFADDGTFKSNYYAASAAEPTSKRCGRGLFNSLLERRPCPIGCALQ
jgi:hypothetical protein